MKGMRYTARQKRYALKLWLEDNVDILKVAYLMKCHERTLWIWKARFDGTLESLENGSTVPHTPNAKAHKKDEIEHIKEIFEKYPDISYTEAYGILRTEYAYSRTYFGFWRFVSKHGIRQPQKTIEKYIEQPYATPEMFGIKMQMDVKVIPRECKKGAFKKEKDYQYTMIDEATRERFIYPYQEQSTFSTIDFIKRAIVYFGYFPAIIQTDNGTEFTTPKIAKSTTVSPVDTFLTKYGIRHKLIRPYTPRHNGKVERSHRTDQKNFYDHLQYSTFEELKEKMAAWLNRYNNCPHSALKNREGKRVFLTPLQKRAELMEDYTRDGFRNELGKEVKIRFLKKRQT